MAGLLFELGEGDSIHGVLRRAVDQDPDRRLLGFVDREATAVEHHTRRQLWDAATTIAGALRRAGIERGDRVCLLMGNRVEIVAAWFACSMLDAIAVPLNTALKGASLEHELRQTSPRLALVEEQLLGQARPSLATSEFVERVVVLPGAAGAAPALPTGDDRYVAYADFLAGAEPVEPVAVVPSSTATIIFTSGTTGRSKGVMLSQRMAVSEADGIRWVMGYRPEDVAFTCLPLFHGNALLCSFFPVLLAGGSCVVAERFSASNLWRQVARAEATTINLLGSMTTILWRQPEREEERTHRLRTVLAVPSPLDYYEEFERRFDVRLTEFYGLTDSQVPLGIPWGERRPGSCGKPTPDWECQLVDENDEPVAPGETGELVTRPRRPFVGFAGYWGNPDASWATCTNQWFHTGDLLRQDEEGWFYFVDRLKDTIRRRGENVSSYMVEEAVLAHPAILEAAAYAAPSEMMEDEVMVAFTLREGGTDLARLRAELLNHCEEQLPYFAVPRYYRTVADFPRTENHKIRKEALRGEGLTADAWDAGERGLRRREQGGGR
jgi:crotonobetaine/carnitine-CoA ligase